MNRNAFFQCLLLTTSSIIIGFYAYELVNADISNRSLFRRSRVALHAEKKEPAQNCEAHIHILTLAGVTQATLDLLDQTLIIAN